MKRFCQRPLFVGRGGGPFELRALFVRGVVRPRLFVLLGGCVLVGCVLAERWPVAASDQDAGGRDNVLLSWDFDSPQDLDDWRPNGHLKDTRVEGGVLKTTVVGWDPILALRELNPPLPARPSQVLEIRLNAPVAGRAEVFWTNTNQGRYGGFSSEKRTAFDVQPGWHTYRLRPFWQAEGRILKLRLDLPGVKTGEPPRTYQLDFVRLVELAAAGQPVPADWRFDTGTEGWRVEGSGQLRAEGGWLTATLPVGSRLAAPPVRVDAYRDVLVSFVLAADNVTAARLVWASTRHNGLAQYAFAVVPDGRPHVYNLPVSSHSGWRGQVIYLGLEPVELTSAAGGKEPRGGGKSVGGSSDRASQPAEVARAESATTPAARWRLDWLRTSSEPVGPPELEVRRLLVEDPLPRAGRAATVLLELADRGAAVKGPVEAKLLLPEGVQLDQGETQTKRLERLDFFEPRRLSWRVVARRSGPATFRVEVSGPGAAGAGGSAGVVRASASETFLPPLSLRQADYVPEPRPVRGDYDVGVYYFPGWASWDRWQRIVPFPERRPVLGWYREGLPEVADWHIKWAVEHGVTFFCYDWYWDRGRTRLTHALHDGYFHARYRRLLKFCLLWANHAPTRHTERDNQAVCRYWIDHYFKRPEYFRVGGRPLVVIFSVWALKRDLGVEGTRKAIQLWHRMTREAGVGEVLVAGCGRPDQLSEMKAMGFDAVTGYNWPRCGVQERNFVPYLEVATKQLDLWWKPLAQAKLLPVLVPTSPGWDSRPWHGQRAFVQVDRTPQAFERHLRLAKKFVEETGQPRVVLIEAWNEWGEGSYCEPHKEYGFRHLDAVRRVFCPDAGPHVDYGPQDVGLGPYDVPQPEPTRPVWTFDTPDDSQGWAASMGLADVHVANGRLTARTTSADPVLVCPVRLRASQWSELEVRMAVSGVGPADQGQLFWATTFTATCEPASVRFQLVPDGRLHTYRLKLSDNSLWRGVVTQLRLDPCGTAGARVEIDSIRLLP